MKAGLKLSGFSQRLACAILRLMGWKLDVNMPAERKFVLIGAPHTSNWDLLYALLLMHAASIKFHWIGKDSLFREPLGSVLRWLGGIPVNRRSRNDFVSQIVQTFNRLEDLVIAIAPEGTRSKTENWRTGFYYIAQGARVPIALGFIDYGEKTVGIGPTIYPTGDIQADFARILSFYAGIKGKYPEKQGEIKIKPD